MEISSLIIVLAGAVAAGVAATTVARAVPPLRLTVSVANHLALLMMITFTIGAGTMAVLRHQAFNSTSYDLAIFDQVMWNSANGRLFENSVMADSPSFLGHHFSPLLLVLVPLYWLYPHATSLLVAQALLLAFAGLPIYWLARDLLHSPTLALSVLAAYLLYPATSYVALFDFHEIVLAVPLLALSLYYLHGRRYRLFLACLLPTLLIKEEMGVIAAAVGVYVALRDRRLAGVGLALGGLVWTWALLRYVIPAFHPSGSYFFLSQYDSLGHSPEDILLALIRHPSEVLARIGSTSNQLYLQQLLAPLAGLPLLGWPVLLIAAPSLGYILLNEFIPSDILHYQYSAPLLPPVFVSTVFGLAWLRARLLSSWPRLSPGLAAFTFAAALLGAYLYGPLPFASQFDAPRYQTAPRISSARALIDQIPPDASVVAQTSLGPQLSHRRTIQVFGYSDPKLRPDYYLLDTAPRANRWPLPSDWDAPYREALARITADAEYEVAAQVDGFLLIRRRAPDIGHLSQTTFGDELTLVGYTIPSDPVAAGDRLPLAIYWKAERKLDRDYSLFAHLIGGTKKVAQRDGYPVGDYPPTSQWEPGRLMRSDWTMPIPAETSPGTYTLSVGLYSLGDLQRLPITAPLAAGDVVSFEETVQIVPASGGQP